MEKIKEISLMNCLSWCGVKELPEEDKNEVVWVRAIGLVAKRDTTHSYVALVKGDNNNVRIVKDFGNVSGIVKIEKVYPYLFLSTMYMPKFKNDTRKEERIAWLSVYDKERDWSELTIKELDNEVINQAIKNQLMASKR